MKDKFGNYTWLGSRRNQKNGMQPIGPEQQPLVLLPSWYIVEWNNSPTYSKNPYAIAYKNMLYYNTREQHKFCMKIVKM